MVRCLANKVWRFGKIRQTFVLYGISVRGKILEGENFGEFGERLAICHL